MMRETLETLIENFSLIDDWEDRYRYLIEMGKALPPLDSQYYQDEYIVRGCTSRVWMYAYYDDQDRLFLRADSDAHIVRGLIAVLITAYDGLSKADAQALDIDKHFAAMGLDSHISPNRRNGFYAMVGRIKALSD